MSRPVYLAESDDMPLYCSKSQIYTHQLIELIENSIHPIILTTITENKLQANMKDPNYHYHQKQKLMKRLFSPVACRRSV